MDASSSHGLMKRTGHYGKKRALIEAWDEIREKSRVITQTLFHFPSTLLSTLSHHSYTLSLSILFLYSLKLHGFTLSPLLNMTHPYEEIKEMKKLKKHYNMLGFVCDAQYGIPTRCPCGGEIMTNVSPTPKYKSDFDTLPGSRYFTCKNYEDDGLHFRQPWAFGVQQEVERLRGEVKELAEEIAKLKRLITSTSRP
ncbi:hypothetical protein Bca4012_050296 [Brassica carinata]